MCTLAIIEEPGCTSKKVYEVSLKSLFLGVVQRAVLHGVQVWPVFGARCALYVRSVVCLPSSMSVCVGLRCALYCLCMRCLSRCRCLISMSVLVGGKQ